jgi:hypothetical protein
VRERREGREGREAVRDRRGEKGEGERWLLVRRAAMMDGWRFGGR